MGTLVLHSRRRGDMAKIAEKVVKEAGAEVEAPARKVSKKELEARMSGLCQSRGWNLGKIREKRERVKV